MTADRGNGGDRQRDRTGQSGRCYRGLDFHGEQHSESCGRCGLRFSPHAVRSLSGFHHRFRRAGLARQHWSGRLYLLQEVVVPLAFDLEVGGGTELDGLDQVMIDVSVDAGLPERVERSPRRTVANELVDQI